MSCIRRGTPLGRAFMWGVSLLEVFSEEESTYLVEQGGNEHLIRRMGECRPERCRSACCRMLCLSGMFSSYLEGFAEMGETAPVVRMHCKFLDADYLCLRWARHDFPKACSDFPSPGDKMYLEVMDTCSFFFEMVENVSALRCREL